MSIDEMLDRLAQRFGKEKIRINTEYHFQVEAQNKKWHNIWRIRGGVRWQMAGMSKSTCGDAEKLLEAFDTYRNDKTDLFRANAAVELCRTIEYATGLLADENVTRAIFCDAGLKKGIARIAVVVVDGDDVEARRRRVINLNYIQQVELAAVTWGIEIRTELSARAGEGKPPLDIYTDSLCTVDSLKIPYVKWLSRKLNKAADRLASLRGNQVEVGV